MITTSSSAPPTKRKAADDARPEPATKHRLALPLCMLEEAQRDEALFFSVAPRDCISHLRRFLHPQRGLIKDPTTLRAQSQVVLSDQIESVCFDEQDNIVAVLYLINEVRVYDKTTFALIRKVGEGYHNNPVACTVDSRGYFFVSEELSDSVSFFDGDGAHERNFTINAPSDLTLNIEEDTLYVCSENTVKIMAIESGQIIGTVMPPNEYISIRSVGFISSGRLLLLLCNEEGDGFIELIDVKCKTAVFFGDADDDDDYDDALFGSSHCTACAHDNIYVINFEMHNVVVFSPRGKLICEFGDDDLHCPTGIAISKSGVVAVADHKAVQLFRCE